MSESDLRDAEDGTTNSDEFEEEFGNRFSDAERQSMDNASQALAQNEPDSRAKPDRKSLRNLMRFNSRKRKLAALGGGGVAFGGGIIGLMITFAPLRIMNYVTHLEDYFFGPVQSAVQAETETLFNHYLQKHVMKGMTINGVCSSTKTITKECINAPAGSNPIQQLYIGWRDGRIENKLANSSRAPFELKRTPDGKYWLKMAILDENGVDVSDFANGSKTDIFDSDGFKNVKRNDVRKAARQAWREGFKTETKWKHALFYFKIGRLLESKHGIKRCIFACDTRDRWGDKVSDAKFAGKALLIERVIKPRAAMSAVALSCLMTTCNVNPEVNTVDVDLADNGEPKSEFDKKLRAELSNLAAKYGTEKLSTLVQEVNKLKEAGSLEKYLFDQLIERSLKGIGVSAASEIASKAGGPLGWINFATKVVNFSISAGPILVSMNYAVNSSQAVAAFSLLRTSSDEMKNHDVALDKIGSTAQLLENGMRDDGTGSSAESVPMYQDINAGSTQTASIFDSLMPSAFASETAAADTPRKYSCDNETHPDTCMHAKYENALTDSSFFVDSIPGLGLIGQIAGLASDFADGVLSPAVNLITKVPPFSNITELISGTFAPMLGLLSSFIIVNQMKNPDGGRIGDGAMFGANIAGNESAHRLIGGKVIKAKQRAEIMESFYASKKAEFANKPLAYRLFNTTDNMSLVAQAASSSPSFSSGGVQSNVASLLSAPFASIGSTLTSLFTTQRTFAAISVDTPQDVTQYGIPLDDPELKNDPEVVYEKYKCGDPENSLTTAYNKASIGEEDPAYHSTGGINQETQQPENTSINYCAVVKTSVASAGARYTKKVLTADDLNSGSQATPTTGGGPTKITGNIDFSDSSGSCPTGTKSLGTVKTRYSGDLVSSPYPTILLCQLSSISGSGDGPSGATVGGGVVVNKQVAAAFQAMGEAAKAAGVPLSGSSFRLEDSCSGTGNGTACAKPGQSPHQIGIAIDFSNIHTKGGSTTSCSGRVTDPAREWGWLHAHAASEFGIKQYSYEAWHWDASNLPNRCP